MGSLKKGKLLWDVAVIFYICIRFALTVASQVQRDECVSPQRVLGLGGTSGNRNAV